MNYIRHLTWVPAIWMMVIIFGFSGENATASSGLSTKVSTKIVEIGETLSGAQLSPDAKMNVIEKIHVMVRKTAHFTEYAILAMLLLLPGYLSWQKRGNRLYVQTEVICVLYAVTDEIHQLFISGRSCRVTDMLIDSAGAATGIIGILILVKLAKYLNNRNKKEKKDNAVASL